MKVDELHRENSVDFWSLKTQFAKDMKCKRLPGQRKSKYFSWSCQFYWKEGTVSRDLNGSLKNSESYEVIYSGIPPLGRIEKYGPLQRAAEEPF